MKRLGSPVSLPDLLPPLVLLFVASVLLCSGFAESLQVILGDPVSFPDRCAPGAQVQVDRIEAEGSRHVATRAAGVWRPHPEYLGRVSEGSAGLRFSRSVYADTGLYQISCAGLSEDVHLNVLVGFYASVTEGGPLRLDCHYTTKGTHVDSVDSVRWEKDGQVVLERNLISGQTSGSEPRASFPPGGDRDGDWSLLLGAARLQDQGDYFCSVRRRGAREAWGTPAAVRLKVLSKDPDPDPDRTSPPSLMPTTPIDTEEKMEASLKSAAIAACVALAVAAPLFFLLGQRMKSRSCRCGPYAPVASRQAKDGPQQANGDLQDTNGDLQDANGDLQDANGDLQDANGDLQDTNGDLQDANGDLQDANGDLQDTNGDLQQANGPNREEVSINAPEKCSLLEIKSEVASPPEEPRDSPIKAVLRG